MLLLPSAVRIYLAAEPVDLRKSIDGLSALVSARGHDPFSGHLYVFQSRRRNRIKILTWDQGGIVLYYKRLEQGRFRLPAIPEGAAEARLDGIDVKRVATPKRWTPPSLRKLDPIP